MKRKLKKFLKRLYKVIKKPEMRILPGQLAFFLVVSIIPLVALIASIVSNFSISVESLMSVVDKTLPREIAIIVNEVIGGKNAGFNITIFYISAFLLASNGPHSMIIGANLLYKVESEDYISRRIKAVLMTIILVILIVFMLLVPAYGDKIISLIVTAIPQAQLQNIIQLTYGLLKYPMSFLFIYFCIKLLYTMAPDKTIKSVTTTYGSIFTTITWILSTEIYSFYVETFNKYNLLYGSIANLLILLMWVYLLSYIFVIGMALNSSHEQLEELKELNLK
ncbi:MAG: YihY/virulence factor BrkB family protein [Firmicutes bacterium]|nr:YihY/virulence factor BrkB family protein [Bacillota bacterium]